MREVVAIFRSKKKIYSTGVFDPLILDVVTGLEEMARHVYGDEFLYFEVDGWSVRSFVGQNDITVVSLSKDGTKRELKHVYESYLVCIAYDDIQLMDVLLSKYRGN